MTWLARLELDYRRQGPATRLRHRHQGPLRVLKSLYPEGDAVCHSVLVHPPSGIVGGDRLELHVQVGTDAHAVLTTPGATRFYRSEGPEALQDVQLTLAPGARLEWLPPENIAYPGCRAGNRLSLELAAGAQCLGWDLCALGLSGEAGRFAHGRFEQAIMWPGVWLERGAIDAGDAPLLDGPCGLAGRRCLGLLFLASGSGWPDAKREELLALARSAIDVAGADGGSAATPVAGATAPNAHVVLVRVLAHDTEPAAQLLRAVRGLWRERLWSLSDAPLRLWAL